MEKFKEKILIIMELAMKVSEKTKADAFVRYYGHVDMLAVDIHTSGWERNHAPEEQYQMCDSDDDIIENLDNAIRSLESLLETEEQK